MKKKFLKLNISKILTFVCFFMFSIKSYSINILNNKCYIFNNINYKYINFSKDLNYINQPLNRNFLKNIFEFEEMYNEDFLMNKYDEFKLTKDLNNSKTDNGNILPVNYIPKNEKILEENYGVDFLKLNYAMIDHKNIYYENTFEPIKYLQNDEEKKLIISSINALSSDGKIAAGYSRFDSYMSKNLSKTFATIWHKDNFTCKKYLKNTKNKYLEVSSIHALSSDGKIAVGKLSCSEHSGIAPIKHYGMICSGDNWDERILLTNIQDSEEGDASINGISGDGKIVVGYSSTNKNETHAIACWGKSWMYYKDLGTLKSDDSGNSIAHAISNNGKIIGGYAENLSNERHATVWFGGNDFFLKRDLGTLKKNNSGNSCVYAFSHNGDIAAGSAENDLNQSHATIWYGNDLTIKRDIGTLKKDNYGNSAIYALSSDGKIAGGTSEDDLNQSRAIIWYGKNLSKKIDVGTLRRDNSGDSAVYAISSDGKTIAGISDTNIFNIKHAFISKLNFENTQNLLKENEINKINYKNNPYISTIDINNTEQSLINLSKDNSDLFQYQKKFLYQLQSKFFLNNKKINILFKSSNKKKSNISCLNFSYRFLKNFYVNTLISHMNLLNLPKTHKINGKNFGLGFSSLLNIPFSSGKNYILSAYSYSIHDISIQRKNLPFIEISTGKSQIKGINRSITFGRIIKKKKITLEWNTGFIKNIIVRKPYEEKNICFPISYDNVEYNDFIRFISYEMNYNILPCLKWNLSLSSYNKDKNKSIFYTGKIRNLRNFFCMERLKKTKYNCITSLTLNFNKNACLSTYIDLIKKPRSYKSGVISFIYKKVF